MRRCEARSPNLVIPCLRYIAQCMSLEALNEVSVLCFNSTTHHRNSLAWMIN